MSKTCLVTGASTGIGRGIAIALANAGHHVIITGRNQTTLDQVSSDFQDQKSSQNSTGKIVGKQCDHSDDQSVDKLFSELEKLDVLVNNAYSGVKAILKVGGEAFWEIEPKIWDDINHVGLRNHYRCSTFAARIMIKNKPEPGLIVNIGSAGGAMTLFNACYGIGKEAKDRMAVEMGRELARKKHNVYAMSLWPGAVKTETVTEMMDGKNLKSAQAFLHGESTLFPGLILAEVLNRMGDKKFMKSVNGKISWTCDMGREFSVKDVDGRVIPSYLQVNYILGMSGWKTLAKFIPNFIKVPKWMFIRNSFNSRFR